MNEKYDIVIYCSKFMQKTYNLIPNLVLNTFHYYSAYEKMFVKMYSH